MASTAVVGSLIALERLDRDIDQNAKRKEGILLHRALGAKDNGHPQLAFVDDTGTPNNTKRGSPKPRKSPTWGANSITPFAFSASATSVFMSTATTIADFPR